MLGLESDVRSLVFSLKLLLVASASMGFLLLSEDLKLLNLKMMIEVAAVHSMFISLKYLAPQS